MTDRDLAILSAKENLSTLDKREGYAEAMKAPQLGWSTCIVFAVIALVFAALTVASWENIAATWLRWIVVLMFGAIAGLAALASLGTSPKLEQTLRWGVAVIDKHAELDKWYLTIMTSDGTERRVPTNEELYKVLRVGDVGVAVVSDNDEHELSSFTRL